MGEAKHGCNLARQTPRLHCFNNLYLQTVDTHVDVYLCYEAELMSSVVTRCQGKAKSAFCVFSLFFSFCMKICSSSVISLILLASLRDKKEKGTDFSLSPSPFYSTLKFLSLLLIILFFSSVLPSVSFLTL